MLSLYAAGRRLVVAKRMGTQRSAPGVGARGVLEGYLTVTRWVLRTAPTLRSRRGARAAARHTAGPTSFG